MKDKNSKPNVLYIITHDQGIGASCFTGFGPDANKKLPTPNIDKFAEQGVILTSHFGTAPFCSPARGSLVTGRVPHSNGLYGLAHRGFEINKEYKTVYKMFTEADYRTILIGLQHETKDAKKLGYNELYKEQYHPKCKRLKKSIKKVFKSLSNENKPWWVSIGTTEIHRSWKVRGKPLNPKDIEVPPYLPDTPEVRKDLAYFNGNLKVYDEFFGYVMEKLDKYGLRDNTIIIFTTDHGIAIPRAKSTLYDPGVHTLMIWNWENKIQPGQKKDHLLSGIDFAPTITELCGIKHPDQFQGKSYAKCLLGESEEINEFVFSENSYGDKYNPIRSVRSKEFKYIRNFEEIPLATAPPPDIQKGYSYPDYVKMVGKKTAPKEEFYDLKNDPLEQENLVLNQPDNSDLIRYRKILEDWLKKTDDPIINGFIPAPDKARVDNADQFQHLNSNL